MLTSFLGQCWHSGGSHPGAPGIGERHSLFAHYRKSCKRSSPLCVFSREPQRSRCADCVFQCDPHDGFPDEWWPDLSERQKQLFRMIHPPGAPHSASSWRSGVASDSRRNRASFNPQKS